MEKECSGWEKIEKLISGKWRGTSIRYARVGTKFRLKMTLLNFWIKWTQKGYFRTKKNENYYRILHIHINLDSKFQFQQTILIFRKNFQIKVYFRSKTQKSEHHNCIVQIQISLTTNVQLKMTIAIFWTKFAKKGSYFQSKSDKIYTIIEFCIFELVFVSNFTLNMLLNILKISKISLFWTFWKKNWLCLASWALFILKLYKAFQTALCK